MLKTQFFPFESAKNNVFLRPKTIFCIPKPFCKVIRSSLMLVQRNAPEASGSGIAQLEAVMYRLRTLNWKRVRPVKFSAGVLAIGGGLALGCEGPTVQMGTSIGDTISRWTKLSPGEKRTLIAVGGVPVLRRHLWAAGRSNIRSRRNKARLSFHRAWRGFCGSSYCGYCGAFSFRRRPCVCNSKLSTPSSLLIAHIRHLGYSGRFTGSSL